MNIKKIKNAALVTGGAKRIGRKIALTLAKNDFDIVLHYNTSKTEAENTAEAIRKFGAKVKIFQADLSDPKSASLLIDKVIKEFPDLSLLINNASEWYIAPSGADSIREKKVKNLNLLVPILLSEKLAEKSRHEVQIINLLDCNTIKRRLAGNASDESGDDKFEIYDFTKNKLTEFTIMSRSDPNLQNTRITGIAPGVAIASTTGDTGNTTTPSLDTTPEAIAEAAVDIAIKNKYKKGSVLMLFDHSVRLLEIEKYMSKEK